MTSERFEDLDRLVGYWLDILKVARNKAAQVASTKQERDSVTYAEGKLNQYLDQRLAAMGKPLEVAPQCSSGPCSQTKATFGTQTWLCPDCDFRQCVGCKERIHSLSLVECPRCGVVIAPPKTADEELD